MRLWQLFLALACAGLCFAEAPGATLRGKLTQRAGQPPAIETGDHKFIALDADAPTEGVLKDQRLAGADLEVKGHYNGANQFVVDPMHTNAMLLHKGGKAFRVTYWCDICSIRTYTPGRCVCCQQETQLDLREPDKE